MHGIAPYYCYEPLMYSRSLRIEFTHRPLFVTVRWIRGGVMQVIDLVLQWHKDSEYAGRIDPSGRVRRFFHNSLKTSDPVACNDA